jgi:hypothetical protein
MENGNINPWLKLWTKPRGTLRAILATDPKGVIIWLAIIAGVLSALSFAIVSWHPPKESSYRLWLLLAMVIGGGIIGIIHLYFVSWLLQLTGSWIGGKGNFIEVKCAVGWSNYPFILADIFAILSVLSTHLIGLKALFALLNLIAAVWGLIIFMKLIGEAHQFSAWKGVCAVLIALVLIFVLLMLIALLAPLLAPIFQ